MTNTLRKEILVTGSHLSVGGRRRLHQTNLCITKSDNPDSPGSDFEKKVKK